MSKLNNTVEMIALILLMVSLMLGTALLAVLLTSTPNVKVKSERQFDLGDSAYKCKEVKNE